MNQTASMPASYAELFQNLQRVIRSLESESISIDELEREVEKAYSIVDVLQQRLNDTSVKVDELIKIKEKSHETPRENGDLQ